MTSRSAFNFIAAIVFTTVFAHAAQAAEPGARPAPPPPLPLLFKESWKSVPEAVPLTQGIVTNPDLVLTVYGEAPDVNSEGGTPHVWTGLCQPACAVTLKLKDSYADLSGKARIKWYTKTSGFHQIRPVVKLADGRLLAGDFVDAYTYDYHSVDFYLGDMKWLLLDAATLTGKGQLLSDVDLSKVDEVGFVDMMPGSGHGAGGFSNVGWIEVYGKSVAR